MLQLALVALIATGCPGNTGSQGTTKGASSGTGTSSAFGGTTGGDLPTGDEESFINVADVVRSNTDPNSLIELIGSNAEIGTQCPTVNDCTCVFNWTEPTGIAREAEQQPARVETNMMRCLFTKVTDTAQFFDVKIKIRAADLFSNTKRVFMTSSNPSLDPSIAANFLPVSRYMCRDVLGKTSNTGFYRNNLVDPRLWQSKFSLVYNFYTTSFGKDYGAVAFTKSDGTTVTTPGYECPAIPNDPAEADPGEGSIYDLSLYTLAGIDLTNPVNQNIDDGDGDNTIYPVDDNNNRNLTSPSCATGDEATCEKFLANRSDYYVSSFKSGVFKQPLCIFHNVGNIGAAGGIQPLDCKVDETSGAAVVGTTRVGDDVLGFAAMPDVNQKCPDINTVKIPAGKKWAKLWQFRLSFQKRSIDDIGNKDEIGDLFCTNRSQECMSSRQADSDGNGTADANNSVCAGAPVTTGPSIGPQATPRKTGNCSTQGQAGTGDSNPITYPFTTSCTNGTSGFTGAGINPNCCLDLNAGGTTIAANTTNTPANLTDGGDFCNPALMGQNDASLWGGSAQDIWLVGNGSRRACIEADTDALGRGPATSAFPPARISNPFTTSPKELDLDSKFDIVYVVTPESVKFEDMQDPEHNKVARQYTPYKLKPDKTTKLSYRLDSDSLNSNNATARLSKFPLCVLQDAKKGANGVAQ